MINKQPQNLLLEKYLTVRPSKPLWNTRKVFKFKNLPIHSYYLDDKSHLCYKLEPTSGYQAKLITNKLEFFITEEYSPFVTLMVEISESHPIIE